MPGVMSIRYSEIGPNSVDAKAVDVNAVDVKAVDAKSTVSDATPAMSPYTEEKSLRLRFAENLRYHRTLQGISQEGLADRAGLHRTFVSQVERGITNVSMDNVEKLARTLNIDPLELFRP